MSFIQNLFTSRDNKADGGTNVGQTGRLWYDPTTNSIYVSDGTTPGGIAVGGGTGNGYPGGSNTQVQFNNGGIFGGSTGFTFNRNTNVLSVAGNVVGGNILTLGAVSAVGNVSATGNVIANYIFGNGSQLTSIPTVLEGDLVGNINANGYYINNLPELSTSGNVTGNYALFNEVVINDLSTNAILYTNSNRAVFNTDFSYDSDTNTMSGGNISVTGNVTGAYILGDGSQLTNLTILGNLAGNLSANGYYINDLTELSVSGNVTGGNLTTGGLVSATGNVTGGNVNAVAVSATGNVRGGNLVTSGDLSVGGNIVGAGATVSLAGTITATDAFINGNFFLSFNGTSLYANAQTTDQISSSKSTGGILIGGTTQTGNITVGVSTATQTVAIGAGITGSGNTKSIVIGNAGASGSTTTIAIGPVAGNSTATFNTATTVVIANTSGSALSVAGNIRGGNILTVGQVSTTGNVTSNFFFGNGSALTGIVPSLSGNLVGNITGNGYGADAFSFVSVTGNVNAGNVLTGGLISATGNITTAGNIASGNIGTAGLISATGNVTVGNISTTGTGTVSNLSVTGNANITNYSYVPKYWFKGTLSGDQALTSIVDTTLLWNNNTDPSSWGSTTASNGQIKPNKAGWYEVTSRVQFSAIAGNAAAQVNTQILVNGSQVAISQLPNAAQVGAGIAMIVTAMVQLNGTTDYITTSCYTTVNGQTCVGVASSMLLVKWIST